MASCPYLAEWEASLSDATIKRDVVNSVISVIAIIAGRYAC